MIASIGFQWKCFCILQMSLSCGCSALSNEIYIQSGRLHINNKEFKDLSQTDFCSSFCPLLASNRKYTSGVNDLFITSCFHQSSMMWWTFINVYGHSQFLLHGDGDKMSPVVGRECWIREFVSYLKWSCLFFLDIAIWFFSCNGVGSQSLQIAGKARVIHCHALCCVWMCACMPAFPDNLFKPRDGAITGKETPLRSKRWVTSQSLLWHDLRCFSFLFFPLQADSSFISCIAFTCEGRAGICDISI